MRKVKDYTYAYPRLQGRPFSRQMPENGTKCRVAKRCRLLVQMTTDSRKQQHATNALTANTSVNNNHSSNSGRSKSNSNRNDRQQGWSSDAVTAAKAKDKAIQLSCGRKSSTLACSGGQDKTINEVLYETLVEQVSGKVWLETKRQTGRRQADRPTGGKAATPVVAVSSYLSASMVAWLPSCELPPLPLITATAPSAIRRGVCCSLVFFVVFALAVERIALSKYSHVRYRNNNNSCDGRQCFYNLHVRK